MDDTAVVAGLVCGQLPFLLHDDDVAPGPPVLQGKRGGEPDNAAADDRNVVGVHGEDYARWGGLLGPGAIRRRGPAIACRTLAGVRFSEGYRYPDGTEASMRLIVVGPGRAGMALATAAAHAGHVVVSIVGRDVDHAAAAARSVDATALGVRDPLPAADLMVIAVRDDAIIPVATQLASVMSTRGEVPVSNAVHLSGLAGLDTLAPLEDVGLAVGSLHPLQTLPDAEHGAARLAGAWIGITAPDGLAARLEDFTADLGAHPFRIGDDEKPLYHAAAAAAANFPLAALTMAFDLFGEAGVPFEAARPLVTAVVDNAFEMGPRAALTGPVARGDVGTVASQLAAVDAAAPEWSGGFRAMVHVLAGIVGREEAFGDVLDAAP